MFIKKISKKTPEKLIESIKKNAASYNFLIREIFDMAKEFKKHGIETNKNFKYYSIMICNPKRAYKSIQKNPDRGAILLPPKQIIIRKNKKGSEVLYSGIDEKEVTKRLPEDEEFQKSLPESCRKIKKLIEMSL